MYLLAIYDIFIRSFTRDQQILFSHRRNIIEAVLFNVGIYNRAFYY